MGIEKKQSWNKRDIYDRRVVASRCETREMSACGRERKAKQFVPSSPLSNHTPPAAACWTHHRAALFFFFFNRPFRPPSPSGIPSSTLPPIPRKVNSWNSFLNYDSWSQSTWNRRIVSPACKSRAPGLTPFLDWPLEM